MPKQKLASLFSTALILALVFSAALTFSASAEEGTPTDPVPTEETSTPSVSDGEAEPTPEPSTIESSSIEESSATEEAVSAEMVATEEPSVATVDESTVIADSETLLAGLPEDTEVNVLDAEGQAIPLASEEAAELIEGGDPIWCPAGVTPKPLMGGCSDSETSLADLLTWLTSNQPSVNGVIWIEWNYSDTTNVEFNGTTLSTMKDYSLSFKGGWSGVSGSTALDPLQPYSQIDHYLWIYDWNNSIILSNLLFTGASDDGLYVETNTGNISLTRVDSTNNSGGGAYLQNDAGTGNVTVNTGHFDQNAGFGNLWVLSRGSITLANVTASGNTNAFGALLNNSTALSAKSVILTGENEFNDNWTNGLELATAGTVTISNLNASDNGVSGTSGYGAYISNMAGIAYGTPGVTLTGANIFNENYQFGLEVDTFGAMKINNLAANLNGERGAFLYNADDTAKPITLSGTSNQFKFNNFTGLEVTSFGAVTLANVAANNNGLSGPLSGGFGVLITNNSGPTSVGVTISGTNSFSNNYRSGLQITTLGLTKLNNVTANTNGRTGSLSGSGVIIDEISSGAGPVTISGANWFNDNYDEGLYIRSTGAITLSNVSANENIAGNGGELNNTLAPAPANVTVSGTNQFNINYYNGLQITSHGAVSLNSVTANFNGLTGSLNGSGLELVGDGGTLARPFKLSGTNTFNGNYDSGLVVDSLGAISVSNLTANNNGAGFGADLSNSLAPSAQPVTISGTNKASDNSNTGIQVYSLGSISINNLTAIGNGDAGAEHGVLLYNADASTAQKVAITGTNVFSGNWVSGIEIQSTGIVTMNNVTASGNGLGGGVKIDNTLGSFIAPVTISGTNVMSGNELSGLEVISYGAIKVSSLTANNSTSGYGASLDNSGSSAGTPPGVSLTGIHTYIGNFDGGVYINAAWSITSTTGLTANDNINGHGADLTAGGSVSLAGLNAFNGNDGSGLSIQADGPVTISKMTASENGDHGASVENNAAFVANVTLSGYAVTSDNGSHGLYILSFGQISIANLTSSGNLGYGATLYNYDGPYKAVILSGKNQLSGNGGDGLNIASVGPITIYNLNASGNGTQGAGSGLWIANSAGGAKPVKLLGTNFFDDNEDLGLQINSGGTVTLNNITANNNGTLFWDLANRSGAYIYNAYAPAASVYLTGVNEFSGNDLTGLTIRTNGSVFLSRITADDNGSDGLFIDNGGAGTVKNVTITCGSFTANTSDGFDITYAGVLTLKGVVAAGNNLVYSDTSPTTPPADVVTVRSC